MFVDAIETATTFTRPIHFITRNYGSTNVHPGAATLFFVNSDGWALTCAHVARSLFASKALSDKYTAFKAELASMKGKEKEKKLRKELELKYDYSEQTTIELKYRFFNCVKAKRLNFEVRFHTTLDIALIKLNSFEQLLCDKFPVFPADTSGLRTGKFLCRLGFPFPEFVNFAYDDTSDSIHWTTSGRRTTPRFPLEGMVTRNVVDTNGQIFAFEMSTPGLRGQSGGPVFDNEGKVWGMQSQTGHLDLNFDVNQEVIRSGLPKRVQDHAFLHVGICIHVNVLKAFMHDNAVRFDEV